jgi:hypothetical protein
VTIRGDRALNISIEYFRADVLRGSVVVRVKLFSTEMNTFDASFYLSTLPSIKICCSDIIYIVINAMSSLVLMLRYGEARFVYQFS